MSGRRGTLAGEAISGQRQFRFSTGPLAVVESAPYNGGTIDEDQTFALRFNGRCAQCRCSARSRGSPERLPARRVATADRNALIRHLGWQQQAANVDAVSCGQRLPAGKRVKLVLTRPGSAERQTLEYPVREAFNASFTCKRESAKAACIQGVRSRCISRRRSRASWPSRSGCGRRTASASRISIAKPKHGLRGQLQAAVPAQCRVYPDAAGWLQG